MQPVKKTSPLFAVNDKSWGVDRTDSADLIVGSLPIGVLRIGEFITPAQIVPIIYVKRHRDEGFK